MDSNVPLVFVCLPQKGDIFGRGKSNQRAGYKLIREEEKLRGCDKPRETRSPSGITCRERNSNKDIAAVNKHLGFFERGG